jgi:dihydroorotase
MVLRSEWLFYISCWEEKPMFSEMQTTRSESFILKDGRLFDPAQGLDKKSDILVKNGLIVAIEDCITQKADKIYDCSGLCITPGFIDLRCRFGEPGYEDRDTISSGLDAAAAGGFVAVCLSPETEPVVDNQAMIEFLHNKAEDHACTLLPVGAVSKGLKREILADLGEMRKAGAVAFTQGNAENLSFAALRGALGYAKMFALPVFVKAQDKSLSGGYVHEGGTSLKMGLKGIPRIAEEIALFGTLRCAEFEDGCIHMQLISSAGSVELLRTAKSKKQLLSADCSVQHIALNDSAVLGFERSLKLDPPLRTEVDRQALIAGILDGTIDALCSDHRSADFDETDREFDYCPFGCSSLETAFSVAYRALVESNVCELELLIKLLATNPRKILGFPECGIAIGDSAELTLLNLDQKWTYNGEDALSLGFNSPWEGASFNARPAGIVNAEFVSLRDE